MILKTKTVKGKGSKLHCLGQSEKFVLWSLEDDTAWFCAQRSLPAREPLVSPEHRLPLLLKDTYMSAFRSMAEGVDPGAKSHLNLYPKCRSELIGQCFLIQMSKSYCHL